MTPVAVFGGWRHHEPEARADLCRDLESQIGSSLGYESPTSDFDWYRGDRVAPGAMAPARSWVGTSRGQWFESQMLVRDPLATGSPGG